MCLVLCAVYVSLSVSVSAGKYVSTVGFLDLPRSKVPKMERKKQKCLICMSQNYRVCEVVSRALTRRHEYAGLVLLDDSHWLDGVDRLAQLGLCQSFYSDLFFPSKSLFFFFFVQAWSWQNIQSRPGCTENTVRCVSVQTVPPFHISFSASRGCVCSSPCTRLASVSLSLA